MNRSVFTISNLFSFCRIFTVIPAVYFVSIERNDIVLLVAVFAMLTDYFDGFLARKLNQITELGKILDPIADKIVIGGTVIALHIYQGFPLWLALLIVLRDVFILIGALFIYDKHKRITASNWPGKISVFCITLVVLFFLLGWNNIYNFSIYLAIIAILFSGAMYAKVFANTFFTRH